MDAQNQMGIRRKKTRISKSRRAGLVLPVTKVHRSVKNMINRLLNINKTIFSLLLIFFGVW